MDLGLIDYKALLAISGCSQRDSLVRWLNREGIPYLCDRKGRPQVQEKRIRDKFKLDGGSAGGESLEW